MKHQGYSVTARFFTPEELEKRYQELMESPSIKRFRYLGERYYAGEATAEEREEYEAETEWMRNLPKSPIPGLIPDDHPLSMGGFPSKSKKVPKVAKEQDHDPGASPPGR